MKRLFLIFSIYFALCLIQSDKTNIVFAEEELPEMTEVIENETSP